jgi:hypothetical protein
LQRHHVMNHTGGECGGPRTHPQVSRGSRWQAVYGRREHNDVLPTGFMF